MQISSQPELLFHGCSADIPLTVSSCVLSVLFFNIFQLHFEVTQYRLCKIFYGHMFTNIFKLYPQCLIIYVLKIPSPKIYPTQCSFDWKHRLMKMNIVIGSDPYFNSTKRITKYLWIILASWCITVFERNLVMCLHMFTCVIFKFCSHQYNSFIEWAI